MMHTRIVALIVFLLILTSNGVSGFQVTSYDVFVTIGPGDGIHERLTVGIANTKAYPLEEFSYDFDSEVNNLKVYDELGDISTEITDGRELTATFREPLAPNSSRKVSIEFDTTGYIASYPDFKEFSMVLRVPANTESFTMKLALPEGAVLLKPLREPLTTSDVVPLPDDVYSDGRLIIFEWSRTNVEDFSVYVKYVAPGSGFGIPRSLIYIAALLALVSALYLWRQRRIEKIEYMKEDEQLIIKEIMQNEGVDQRDIQRKTDFSKAKVSNIISELENRGIVRKEKVGRRNKLYLTKEFKSS